MKRIKISAEFEREIRSCGPGSAAEGIVEKLVRLLDAEEPKKAPGVSYSKILECLREGLGQRLATPRSPHVSWIVRMVNRVKELGLDEQQLRELGHRAAQTYNNSRPVELEYILRAAVRLLTPVDSVHSQGASGGSRVYTGRSDDDDTI